jgi:hypothetical protein
VQWMKLTTTSNNTQTHLLSARHNVDRLTATPIIHHGHITFALTRHTAHCRTRAVGEVDPRHRACACRL